MTQYLKMAVRDLTRNVRRSVLSALALGMGLALLLLMAAVLHGEMQDAMKTSIKLSSGHIQIRAVSYDEAKASLQWKDLVEDPGTVVQKIMSIPDVLVATPRLYASGILEVGDTSTGVQLMGIDPTSDASSPYRDGVISGQFITPDDRDGLMIGQSLSDKLKIKAGDSIQVLANTANGDVDQQTFTVRGIYTTHTPSVDEGIVLLPLAKLQAITQTENHASTIFVLLKDQNKTDAVVSQLHTSEFKVLTWQGMNILLTQIEDLSNASMMVLYLIVLAVTATVVVNALIMSVFERTREIGILSAIGMRSSKIMGMFLTESALLSFGGIIIGLILGVLLALYSSRIGFYIGNMGVTGYALGERIYGSLTMSDTVSLTLTALIVTLLASLYPAILASRMEPVDALRRGK
jgi:ABC-type lipoprotein release transport system permease subunit